MSYQVGKYCYADQASAAFAACSAFAPVTAILQASGDVRTLSCAGVVEQSLKLAVVTTSTADGKSTVSEITQQIAFPPCMQSDLVQSWETIAGALLASWAVVYGLWKVYTIVTVNPRTGD
jgi:hypothetical protein